MEVEMRGLSVEALGWRGSRWAVAPLLALLLLGVCLAPSSAAAKSYHAFLCRIPYGPEAEHPAPVEDVTYANGSYMQAGNDCASGGSVYAQMDGETSHPYNTGAYDTFEAPTGLTISGFTLWRYEATVEGVAYGSPESKLEYIPGPAAAGTLCTGTCSYGTQAEPFNPANKISVGELSGVSKIQWAARCGGGPTGTCPSYGPQYSGDLSAQYDVYAADIDLVDDTPPTFSEVSGPLVSGEPLSGEQSVSFDAHDGQSGVYAGSLVVDGKTAVSQILDSNGGHCQSLNVTGDGQRSFAGVQPCEPSLSASLTLNTGTLTAGAHSLELIVEDAAGNQTIAYNKTITVAGPPSTTGGSPGGGSSGSSGSTGSTGSTGSNGSNGSTGSTGLTGSTGSTGSSPDSVFNSALVQIGPGSPLAERGPANGLNASDQVKLTARWSRTSRATLASRYGVRQRIVGRLQTSTGQPISGALLDLFATPAYEGAQARLSGTGVRTGPTGAWTLTLPADVSSTALRFVYRSHQNDTVAAATATLSLGVHAGIALKIAPRTVSVGRKIFFNGVLHGVPIPPGGKQLVLEASSGGGWVQFDTIRTGPRGRYHASYRFKFPGPISYRFRVLSPYEADFPFLDGTSDVAGVYER
jgi:hypothetical protein